MSLTRIAAAPEALLNGVAVAPGGRVFSSFPRWSEAPTPSLGEATPEGGFRPFPGAGWNDWQPGAPPEAQFVSVHSSHADAANNLWVVDDAAPYHGARVPGGPKLVKIDLATDRVSRVYPIPESLAPLGAVLGHVRVDARFAYLTELRLGALLVIDLATGEGRRLLDQEPKTRADPTIVPVVDGRDFRLAATGKPPTVHIDLLQLSGDGAWLYFMPLFGPMLRRVPVAALQDRSLSAAALGATIEDVAAVPPCAGLARDAQDRLYFSSFTQNAILRLGPDRRLETLLADPRISFPNEGAIGPDGHLYFPSSQIHRSAAFQPDHRSRVVPPFEIFRLDVTD